ncbi:MAG TPA: DUF2877 domain-containing protein [Anaerolineales bacterium]|nr:DUF2877 domain-containing protein [Anaerolineales bacterium]
MQFLNATSVTSHVRDWLASSQHPRILHIFDNACNLINERREVLSIVTPQIGNGPFNLVIEENICFSEHLSLQSSIFISGRKVTLGDLTIYASDAKLWNPRPDWERLHEKLNHILDQAAQLLITNYKFSNSLSSSLAVADLPSSLTAAKQLAGLGAGLTPAGDDFIMGAIHATWILHPHEGASALTQSIADTAAPLTTSLSAAWLRSAGRGEAGVLWHQFFEALVGQIVNPTYVQEAMDNILSVGETSGADALAGFISTLNSISHSNL